MNAARFWAVLAALLWLVFAVYGGTANAHADGLCTTSHYSDTTYTICTWTDAAGWQHRSVETCYYNVPTCSVKGD